MLFGYLRYEETSIFFFGKNWRSPGRPIGIRSPYNGTANGLANLRVSPANMKPGLVSVLGADFSHGRASLARGSDGAWHPRSRHACLWIGPRIARTRCKKTGTPSTIDTGIGYEPDPFTSRQPARKTR